jgi:hypothetical protein
VFVERGWNSLQQFHAIKADGVLFRVDVFGAQVSHVRLRRANFPEELVITATLGILLAFHDAAVFLHVEATFKFELEAEVGIEPTHTAFAEPCLTTWLLRRLKTFKV